MPVVNPGIRRFLGSAIQRLFNSASFYAPLTHSLVPERGTGSPTFTRATTKTWQNNDGYLVTGVAGEIGFVGARRVRNLLTATEAFDTAAWGKSNATMTANQIAAPDGTTTADLFTATANAQQTVWFAAGIAGVYSTVYSAYVKAGTATWLNFTLWDGAGVLGAGIQVWFNLTTGAVGNTVVGAGFALSGTSSTFVGNGWYRISIAGTASGGSFLPAFRITDSNGVNVTTATSGKTFYIWGAQLEDVTAQTTQTAGEYVSVGVESAPAYHGSMVDGVKCYDTDRSGNPLTTLKGYLAEGARTNLCLQSNAFTTTWAAVGTPAATQNATGPDGATSAWTLTDNDGAATEGISQDITLTAATHTFSVFVKKTSGATSFPIIYAYDLGANVALCTIDSNNGVATVWTAYTALTIVTSSARCVSYNDDYWRVSLTYLPTAASWRHYIVPAGTTSATQATGTLNVAAQGSAVFYGAQVELGSFASSYIPTTTVAVTRNADVLTYPSAGNVSGTTGWCYAEATPYVISSGNQVILGSNGANRAPMYQLATSGYLASYDGTNAPNLVSTSLTANTANKVAATWGGVLQLGAKNGIAGASAAFDGNYDFTDISVGINNSSTNSYFGTIRNVRIGQRALSLSELQAITA